MIEKVQIWGIVVAVLGVLTIAAFTCPSIWSNIVLGVLVLVFGVLTVIYGGKAKSKGTPSPREASKP